MGCGESKHAVATSDTVATRKGNAAATAAAKKDETINVTEPSPTASPSPDAGMANGDVNGNINQTESLVSEKPTVASENSEPSTGDVKKGEEADSTADEAKLIAAERSSIVDDDEESSNRFVDAAEGSVSVEPSEKSMYFTPRHGSKTTSLESVVAAEEIKVEIENEGMAVKEEDKVVEKEDKAVKEEDKVAEAAKVEKETTNGGNDVKADDRSL